ncbi:MAG: response regulator transcription factor, partial [Candidatus Aminicenantales bacterium]
MKKILIIEDDEALIQTLITALQLENFEVISAQDGEKGLELALREKVDLIIIDWVLPSLSGLEICKKLRAQNLNTPIIILSGKKKEEMDKVIGLELGADDYIIKPFGTKEFVARVKAVLRRTRPAKPELEEYSFQDVYLNFKKQIARKGKKEIHLTAREYN